MIKLWRNGKYRYDGVFFSISWTFSMSSQILLIALHFPPTRILTDFGIFVPRTGQFRILFRRNNQAGKIDDANKMHRKKYLSIHHRRLLPIRKLWLACFQLIYILAVINRIVDRFHYSSTKENWLRILGSKVYCRYSLIVFCMIKSVIELFSSAPRWSMCRCFYWAFDYEKICKQVIAIQIYSVGNVKRISSLNAWVCQMKHRTTLVRPLKPRNH